MPFYSDLLGVRDRSDRAPRSLARLLDGGAYDNMGLEPLDELAEVCVVAINAGGLFRVGFGGRVPIVRDLLRSNSLLYRQSTALRRRAMVERFRPLEKARREGRPVPEWGRLGVLFNLATTVEPTEEWGSGRPDLDEQRRLELALLPTSFMSAPILRSSPACRKRWGKIVSVRTLSPSAVLMSVIICACMSVGKPG